MLVLVCLVVMVAELLVVLSDIVTGRFHTSDSIPMICISRGADGCRNAIDGRRPSS